MDIMAATRALGALAQETRLEAFRLLVRSGMEGMPAGEIARTLEIPHNTLSSHLAILSRGGLINSRRDGRSIIYSVDFAGTCELLSFLVEDCCQGHPELCGNILDDILSGCCQRADAHAGKHDTTAC